MVPKRDWIAALTAFAGTILLAGPVRAQSEDPASQKAAVRDSLLRGATVMLRVDGLSCPFCAYGLEKHLRDIPAVDTLIIRVSDGLVQIRVKQGQTLDDAQLREAVERAGFTLRDIRRLGRP